MTRTVDLAHRAELLDRISDYVVNHGFAELSLRPLAAAVGISPRTLLHHFGSKEAIVGAVLQRIRARQRVVFSALRKQDLGTPGAVCKAAWAYMAQPNVVPTIRLFFETYALASRDPQRFPGFIEGAIDEWLAFLSEPIRAGGVDPARARSLATIILAGYRGFMLDLVATEDYKRVGRALDLWAESLAELIP